MSLYFQYNKGLSPQTSGLILVIPAVVMAIFTPIAGRLSDKIEPLRVASIGIGVLLASLYLLSLLTEESSLRNIIFILIVFGLGAGFFAAPNTNAVMSSVERKFFGVAAGTLATMRHSGQVISMGIIMILFFLKRLTFKSGLSVFASNRANTSRPSTPSKTRTIPSVVGSTVKPYAITMSEILRSREPTISNFSPLDSAHSSFNFQKAKMATRALSRAIK
ncbi:hypothetical protein ES703_78436 [subsurface metagenome]